MAFFITASMAQLAKVSDTQAVGHESEPRPDHSFILKVVS